MEHSATTVCIGALVRSEGKVLLVRQAAGHSLAGQWTIPWGRLDPGESPAAAAARETLEEGGITAKAVALLGVQELPSPWQGWLALIYECEHVSGEPCPDGAETDAARYFSAAEVTQLNEPIEAWSAWLLRRCFSEQVVRIGRADAENPFHPALAFL